MASSTELLTLCGKWINALLILASQFFVWLCNLALKLIYLLLSVGPLPDHMAFIMDGNRRYARKHNLEEVDAYQTGSATLLSTLKYCCELRIKYITVYAFSIDNFKRRPEDIGILMDLMLEKMERLLEEANVLNQYGIRICFAGDLRLLNETVRVAAEKVMAATAGNTSTVLLICVAYTSTDEIAHAIQGACLHKLKDEAAKFMNVIKQDNHLPNIIGLTDIERHMYMALAPEPDLLVRTSGETRLSNFLLWQTPSCLMYSPAVLWPEFGLRHLIWVLLNFQRYHHYLEKKKKQL